MSRASFPRVAPRTRPKPPRSAKLPPLLVAIYQDGTFAKYVEIPDPRDGFVREFNEQSAQFGMSAEPVTEGGEAHV